MRRRFNTTSSFLDMLFNINLCFFVLLCLAMFLIKPPASNKDGDITLKAEVMITIEWGAESKDDVDLWVRSPQKEIVFYANPNIGAMSLDRDDRGQRNDVIKLEDGAVEIIKENWEHVIVRKTVPGEYVVNLMMFSKVDTTPTKVKVKIEKLNPYQVIFQKEVLLSSQNQEETIVRFNISKNGKTSVLSRDPELLSPQVGRYND